MDTSVATWHEVAVCEMDDIPYFSRPFPCCKTKFCGHSGVQHVRRVWHGCLGRPLC